MNVDFEKKPFSDKNADLKVYFADTEQDWSRQFEQLEAKFEFQNENMKAEINRLRMAEVENKNIRVKHEGEINQLKTAVQQISNEIARLNVRALHRRVMLDKIRDKLVDKGVIPDDFKPTQNSNTLNRIVPLVIQGLNRNTHGLEMLSPPAIRAIFDTNLNTLRNDGNDVAHNASEKDIAEAVLDSRLTETDRENAKELFMWLNDGRKPTLQRNA
ncbi:hypothetical protein Clacol_004938 [Clathrus columnatus]|uniref:Uncharacterized protein n=1 Tax=Clathrus columnatus TaxID=1419009 RepID=A0AAV5A7V9_9AGAM|nr:hypothetical protein Clacol_004938 [Clathrus columnatus]